MANPGQQFQQVIMPKTPRSRQDLSHTFKFTCDIGPLIPTLCMEVLPHDVAKVRSDVFLRFMPLVFPILHEVDVYMHYFEVPWYLLFDKWSKFIIPQKNEGIAEGQTPIPIPQYFEPADLVAHVDLLSKGSLLDYLGVPPVEPSGPSGDIGTSAAVADDCKLLLAPAIAYQLIYDSYYRDEHLEAEMDFDAIRAFDGDIMDTDLGSPTLIDLLTLRYRAWEKDLFTSALPEPQFGTPQGILLDLSKLVGDVSLLSAGDIDGENVPYLRKWVAPDPQAEPPTDASWEDDFDSGSTSAVPLKYHLSDDRNILVSNGEEGPLFYNPAGSLQTKFNMQRPENMQGASFTIEQLRFAYREEAFKEMLQVGGNRDTEVIRSQFSIIPDDLTIGRPRYLGGGKQNVVISEVLQQSQTDSTSILGDFAGHGLSVGSANSFKARFKYWGFVLGIMSIRPRSGYGQGVPKMFLKFDRYDHYWPHLAHLGEQPVKNGEVFWSYADGKNNEEFGYQQIYHDYRYIPSRIAGEMRDTLADWHMNRLFSSRPSLNADFVKINPDDVNHVFAVPSGSQTYPYAHHIICEVFNSVQMIRPMPKYSTPTL